MIAVIITGGSGTRLWPLSTPSFPKQLLKVDGDEHSLLQHTYERAKRLTDSIYFVPEVSLMEHVRQQLPDLDDDAFIVEPARRGTANCILAALHHVAARHDPDEPVVFLSADHHIRDNDGFVHSFKVASEVSQAQKRIVLVGAEPDHAATGFGYIQKDGLLNDHDFVYNVHSFKEKPDFATAQEYLQSGNYLWNCGYFVASVNTFIETMQAVAPELYANYQKLQTANDSDFASVYLGLESIAIDYALIEKATNLLVVPATFDWMDLGSFGDLHKAMESDKEGNHKHGLIETEAVRNSFIQNLENKPVAVIGLDNVVVVNTPDGILVARKDMAQKVGSVSKRFNP